MISEFYKDMTGKESVIRQFFDFARKRIAEMGPDSVYNFSIGNPSVPAPDSFTKALIDIVENRQLNKLSFTCKLQPKENGNFHDLSYDTCIATCIF